MRRARRAGHSGRRRPPWLVVVELALLAALAVGGAAGLRAFGRALASPGPSPTDEPRHLVLIVLDTLRADRTSVYGYGKRTTPFLEAEAANMLRYGRATAPAPWTVPVHASIFTGLWPAEHGAQWGSISLGDEHVTLAEILSRNGFATAGLSSNMMVSEVTNLSQGFDSFQFFRRGWRTKSRRTVDALPSVIDEALESKERMFLFLNFMDTHLPYNYYAYGEEFGLEGAPPLRGARHEWAANAGRLELDEEDLGQHGAAYDASVRYVDEVVRDVFGVLRDKGILEQSLVVVVSDHGDGLGAHRELGHCISVWEEQLWVPLLVRFPGRRRAGETFEEQVSLTGLGTSMLEWLGVPREAGFVDAPTLEETAQEPISSGYRSYFAEQDRRVNRRLSKRYPQLAGRVHHSHVVYCDDLKLIVDASGRISFYDLRSDPTEQEDLAGPTAEGLARCLETYERLLSEERFRPLHEEDDDEAIDEPRPEEIEALQALGYIL